MFAQFIAPNKPTATAARDFFLIHPRNTATIAEVLTTHFNRYGFNPQIPNDLREAIKADAATLSEALSIAATRYIEEEETERAHMASLDAHCGRDE